MNAPLRMLGVALVLGVAPFEARSASLTCESRDNQWHTCAADTRGGVTLVRQLSRAGCWQGDTWGHDRNRIWVNHGCRAEFHTGAVNARQGLGRRFGNAPVLGVLDHGDRGRGDTRREAHRGTNPRSQDYGHHTAGHFEETGRNFSCASTRNGLTWCRQAVDRLNRVEIRRQLSQAACTYGRSWGVDRADVWVNYGCRAEFVVY